ITQEVRALVLERAEVGVSVATAQQIVEHTEGSFLAIDSMLSSLTPHETAQLHLSWNPTLRAFQHARDPLLHQFSGLSAAAQTTCEVVCLASHEISRGELTEVLATLHTPLALDEALDAGVLILSG